MFKWIQSNERRRDLRNEHFETEDSWQHLWKLAISATLIIETCGFYHWKALDELFTIVMNTTMDHLLEMLKTRFEKLSHMLGWSHGMREICQGLQNNLQPSLTYLWQHQNSVKVYSRRTLIFQVAFDILGWRVPFLFLIRGIFCWFFLYLILFTHLHQE